jgi:hypothetical protein
MIVNFETDEIDASASPLNQKVITLYKSSKLLIFEVVYLSIEMNKSSFSIHSQSSKTSIYDFHQSFISIFIFLLQASIEFSTNSFTTDKGLSTTSQAAIWFAKF